LVSPVVYRVDLVCIGYGNFFCRSEDKKMRPKKVFLNNNVQLTVWPAGSKYILAVFAQIIPLSSFSHAITSRAKRYTNEESNPALPRTINIGNKSVEGYPILRSFFRT
jgi:hypothetical protein